MTRGQTRKEIKVNTAVKVTQQKKAPIWTGGETTAARITGQVVAPLAGRAVVQGVRAAVRAVVTGVGSAGTRVGGAASTKKRAGSGLESLGSLVRSSDSLRRHGSMAH